MSLLTQVAVTLLVFTFACANLLLNGKVTDLITYSTYGPESAVDGNILTLYHSDLSTNSWLDVETANAVTVNTILIIFSENCCYGGSRNIYLETRVGNSPPSATNSEVNTICHASPTDLTGWY